MLDILRDYLQQSTTPETLAALEAAHATFERIGLENYEPGFTELLMLNEESELGAGVIYTTELTLHLQRRILSEHGVLLDRDNFSVSTHNRYIEGILDLQDYSDKSAIARTLEMTGTPEELFAEVLTLVTDESADNLMVHISSVNQFLITRLKDLCNKEAEPVDIVDDKYINKLLDYFTYLETPPPLAGELLRTILPGYTFVTYLNVIGRELELLPEPQAARELVALAYVSRDGIDNPRAIIKEHIDKYVANIDQITRIDVAINEILLGMNQHEQS